MSNGAIFLVGLPITFVVFVALGILAYAIKLEGRDLAAAKLEREATGAPSAPGAAAGPVVSLHPVDSLADRASAKHRSAAENAGEAVASSPPSAA